MSQLFIEDLKIGYQDHVIAEQINLSLPNGCVSCLPGRNGSGKSTFLKTILGLLPPISGKIWLERQYIALLSRKQLAKQIADVLQLQNH